MPNDSAAVQRSLGAISLTDEDLMHLSLPAQHGAEASTRVARLGLRKAGWISKQGAGTHTEADTDRTQRDRKRESIKTTESKMNMVHREGTADAHTEGARVIKTRARASNRAQVHREGTTDTQTEEARVDKKESKRIKQGTGTQRGNYKRSNRGSES